MFNSLIRNSVIFAVCFLIGSQLGCMTAAQHSQSLHSADQRAMTLGIVQKEIRRGMSQAEVTEALGSPNMINRDGDGREVWVYDKIATEASYSRDSGGAGFLGGAGGAPASALILGLGSGSYSRSAGAAASTQRTLTVLIKFGKDDRVENFSYHSSQF